MTISDTSTTSMSLGRWRSNPFCSCQKNVQHYSISTLSFRRLRYSTPGMYSLHATIFNVHL